MEIISTGRKEKYQMMLFSATIPSWIRSVAARYLDPKHVIVDLVKDLKNKTSSTVTHLAINVPFFTRTATLCDVLKCYGGLHGKTIVFVETKKEAASLMLSDNFSSDVEAMHGDIAQN